ncbi:hypothetical protein EI94DRAFT_1835376 [Lactarius quietus]|nr:hypothetical protein EI94DRAFT_1835376 [Lactarius quietus]
MASTNSNPPITRLSRSTSERPEPGKQGSRKASSSRIESGKDKLPQAKIQALEQFVKFGRKGKLKEKEKETQAGTEVWPDSTSLSTAFVPPSPVVAAADSGVSTPARRVSRRDTSQTPHRADSTSSQIPRPMPAGSSHTLRPERAGPGVDTPYAAGTTTVTPPGAHGATPLNPGAPNDEEQIAPEPLTLARRIQAMFSLRTAPPTPSATDATTSRTGSSEAAIPITPGSSIPPAPVTDSRFLELLGNTNVMSGSSSTDKRRSVFEILDHLRRPSGRAMEASNHLPSSVSEEEQENEDSEYDDDSSIMLYGPLVPSEDSEVELAASDIMSVLDDGETFEFERPARPISFFDAGEHLTPRSPPASLLPVTPEERHIQEAPSDDQPRTQEEPEALGWFDTWKGKMIEGRKLVSETVAEGTKSWKDKTPEGRKIVKTKTRWVPSPDKISFQATWWGYRLYLPPPILDVLNNKRLEAAKRAAIITTALQWLLGQVPLTVLPPQFRPGLLVAQRLVPYLGYIGGFVAWSWGAMKSFDKGHGIVLTATWLLPVALIPGTWEAKGDGDSPGVSRCRRPLSRQVPLPKHESPTFITFFTSQNDAIWGTRMNTDHTAVETSYYLLYY